LVKFSKGFVARNWWKILIVLSFLISAAANIFFGG